MDLLFCLESILSDFRHLSNQQNFALLKRLFNVVILDNGRFHHAKALMVPENVILVFLPLMRYGLLEMV